VNLFCHTGIGLWKDSIPRGWSLCISQRNHGTVSHQLRIGNLWWCEL